MRTLLFILFLFVCTGSPAQNVQFGSESESDSYRNIPFFLGKMDGKIYTIRITGYAASVYTQLMKSDGKAAASAMILGVSKFSDDAPFAQQRLYFSQSSRVYLEIYDEELKQLSSNEVILKPNPKANEIKPVQFEMAGQNLYAFAYEEDENGPGNRLVAYTLSNRGELNFDGQVVASYNTENKNVRAKRSHTFRIYPSPDRNHLLIVHSFLRQPKNGEDRKYLYFSLVDHNLNPVLQKDVDIKSEAEGMELVNCKVSDAGDAAFLIKYKNPDSDGPEYLYDVYTWLQAQGKFSRFELGMDGYYTNDILFEFHNGHLIISGFFSGRSKSSAEGYFYSKMDVNTGKEVSGAREKFDKDFMELALGKEKAEDAEYLTNLHMRKVFAMEDGGLSFVAEQYYIVYMNNSFTFNYGNTFLLRFDAAGKIIQQEKIEKKQRTSDDGGFFNSVCMVKNHEALYFIYNANRNNPSERMSNTNKASVYMTRIPFNGSAQETNLLFNGKEQETVAVPKVFFQESPSSVIFYNYKRLDYKFARVKF